MKTKYKINEIFYSIQTEGSLTGSPAVFVRFSGCNLSCPFCDTNHEKFVLMTKEEIEAKVDELDKTKEAMVVFTGGEPTLYLTDEEPWFRDRYTAIETNGIVRSPRWINHITISPKTHLPDDSLLSADAIKVLFGWFKADELERIEKLCDEAMPVLYMQPTADKDGKFDIIPVVNWIKKHPQWSISIQWHKIFGIQ